MTHSLRADGFDASEDGTGRGTPLVPVHVDQIASTLTSAPLSKASHGKKSGTDRETLVAFDTTQITSRENRCNPKAGDPCHPLAAGAHAPTVAFQTPALNGSDAGETSDMRPCVATATAVRRLTPKECARLQGFPDDYLDIHFRGKPAADGPKYKALGNSMAVPVIHWIGERLQLVSKL